MTAIRPRSRLLLAVGVAAVLLVATLAAFYLFRPGLPPQRENADFWPA